MKNGHGRIERRAFLRAMGVGAAVLPLLEAERAGAQSAVSQPKRSIFVCWPDGMLNRDEDWPAAGTDFTLPDFMQSHEPYRNDMIFMRGMRYRFIRDSPDISERTGHAAYPGMLTGAMYSSGGSSTANDVAGGLSIDQYIGNSLRAQGYDGLVSLNLGVKVDSTARLCWRGAGANNAIVPNEDPYEVFNDLFAGAQADPNAPDPAITRVNSMRRSILDFVVGDLGRFSASLGKNDRERIDAHLTSVRELEQKLQATAGRGDLSALAPTLPQGINVGSTVNFHTTTEMQMRIITAALAADITRSVVLQLGDQGGANIVLTPLGFDADNRQTSGNTGLVEGLHVIAHEDTDRKRRTDGWFQDQIANFVKLLNDTQDSNGRLLDSTVLVAMNNMRTGNHQTDDLPAVLAGSMGGYFKTGRSVSFDAANNGLLIAVANAVGVPTQTFGEAEYGGELAVLRG